MADYNVTKDGTYVGRTIRAFLSYSTKDKAIVGQIKDGFEELGIEVFLAHEDITPSLEWAETILSELNSTDIFVPIISNNFKISDFTDQESGFAIAKDKYIFPISIDGKVIPYGFINKYQAFKYNTKLNKLEIENVLKGILKQKPDFEASILDSVIKSFATSFTFDQAGQRAKLLLQFSNISKYQAEGILRAIYKNEQIFGSRTAKRSINKLLDNFETNNLTTKTKLRLVRQKII